MQDEEEIAALTNACADLVSLGDNEPFLRRLFETKPPGEWIKVRELCEQNRAFWDDLSPGLFATWLADPRGYDGYALVMFYDAESYWSMAAHYNRARLLNSELVSQVRQPREATPATSEKCRNERRTA